MGDADKLPFTLAMIAGGCAGTTVDVVLFPLDTLKTRLQAEGGFMKAGGFNGVFNGVVATAIGAAPGAAMFFSAYEGMKPKLQNLNGGKEHPLHHSIAASCGEVAACLVRVPTGVVTQNMQVGKYASFVEALRGIASGPGGLMSFYTGYWTTVAREIPFSFIQFPMYEGLKKLIRSSQVRLRRCRRHRRICSVACRFCVPGDGKYCEHFTAKTCAAGAAGGRVGAGMSASACARQGVFCSLPRVPIASGGVG